MNYTNFKQYCNQHWFYNFILLIVSVVIAFTPSLTGATEYFPKNTEGWSIFEASPESHIIYVSSSGGNDETGTSYTIEEIGYRPFTPKTKERLNAFKTFSAAFKKTRNNKPDWILIKRGDTFFESIKVRNGKSLTEPFLVATYGPKKTNPIFNTGTNSALQICCKNFNFIAVQGLDFYAHTRMPKSEYFNSHNGKDGLNVYIGEEHIGNGLLIEGNRFNFYTNNVVQGPGTLKNIMIRRNSFFDNYSTTSHSQGFYAANISVTLEENIFDHNGWLVQADKGLIQADKAQGAATVFNHNTYFANTYNVEFIKNIFLRSSSIHNKWTANEGKHSSSNIRIENNLYIDGEIGISAGGNKTGAHRFKNYQIIGNVMLNIGQSRPTNRDLSWGIDITDWDGGRVENNILMNQSQQAIKNVFGIAISGETQNITITNNQINNLMNSNGIVLNNDGDKRNIAITNNKFNFIDSSRFFIKFNKNLNGYHFKGNQYFHPDGQCDFFIKSDINYGRLYKLWSKYIGFSNDCENTNFTQWKLMTKETNKQWGMPKFLNKTLETYQQSIDKTPTQEAFIKALRNMSINNWDTRYTAETINQYFKKTYKTVKH